jgi:hypothetical protein
MAVTTAKRCSGSPGWNVERRTVAVATLCGVQAGRQRKWTREQFNRVGKAEVRQRLCSKSSAVESRHRANDIKIHETSLSNHFGQ